MNWFPFNYILANLITNSIHVWLTKVYRSSSILAKRKTRKSQAHNKVIHIGSNIDWLNWQGEPVEVCHAMLLLPKNCWVFWKRQPWVSLAEVTLLVGVHKYLRNFWFKRVEDLHPSEPNCKNQKWGPADFSLKRAERNLLCKSLPLGCVPLIIVITSNNLYQLIIVITSINGY